MEAVMASSSKVLVDVEGGNNMLYLPLDKLVGQQGAKPAEATNMTPAEISSIADQVIEKLRSQTTSVQRREPRE
jgi:membrane protease subunit HflK